MHSPKSLAAAMLLFSAFACTTSALGQKTDSRDEAAIHDYVLTVPKVKTYAAALKDYQATAAKNAAIANECKGKANDDNMSLTDKQKAIESGCPLMKAWIQQHGLTTHDFLFLPITAITAGLARAAGEKGGKAPTYVNPANVQFVKDHQAELQELHFGDSE